MKIIEEKSEFTLVHNLESKITKNLVKTVHKILKESALPRKIKNIALVNATANFLLTIAKGFPVLSDQTKYIFNTSERVLEALISLELCEEKGIVDDK